MDGLDARLITYLNANLFEDFSADQQPIEKPDGYSLTASGMVRPKWMRTALPTPPFRYSGKETRATLNSLKEAGGDPYDGIHLQYVNPLTGGPTLPTFGCEVQLILPQQTTRPHRHMSTAVYFVSEGQGSTTIGNEVFQWSTGDFFLIPPWQRHAHANRTDRDAILFSVNDAPAMQALGIYREEPVDS